MNIILLGAAGFIGTNLTIRLAQETEAQITLVDRKLEYFSHLKPVMTNSHNIDYQISNLSEETNFDELLSGKDVVYHLISTTVPSNSNQQISQELQANVILSSNLFEACVRQGVKRVVFISSGGTIYGKDVNCPISENTSTCPITSYGVQKITIEKLLYLYWYIYGLDYRVIRLSNPYGPYQKPNGIVGAVTTFIYKALKGEEIAVYGDGSVVRDYIYIDDAVRGILNIVNSADRYRTFNLGCGYGTSITQLIATIERALDMHPNIAYKEARKVDVPTNFLDIGRYEAACGALNPLPLEDGIKKTAAFMRNTGMV